MNERKKETKVVANAGASHGFYLQEPQKCDKVPTKLQQLLPLTCLYTHSVCLWLLISSEQPACPSYGNKKGEFTEVTRNIIQFIWGVYYALGIRDHAHDILDRALEHRSRHLNHYG
jgi:hypothetical protein